MTEKHKSSEVPKNLRCLCPACGRNFQVPWRLLKVMFGIVPADWGWVNRIDCPNCYTNLDLETEPGWAAFIDETSDFEVYTQIERVWATIVDCSTVRGGAARMKMIWREKAWKEGS